MAEVPQGGPGPLAVVTGRYPGVSLTFIDREVRALRAAGCEVVTVTIRAPREIAGAFQREEARRVHRLLASARNPVVLGRAALAAAARPRRLLAMLHLAIRARPDGGAEALARHAAHVAEAVLLARVLRQQGVVHVHNHLGDSSGTVTMLASELAGLPFSMTLHGPEVFDDAGRWRLDVKIARAHATICISEDGRAKALRHAAGADRDRIAVIPCGVAPERYAAAAPRGRTLLFVGRLVPRKGAVVLVEALALLRAAGRDTELHIAGDGPERESLTARVAELGLGGAVRFLGVLDESGVAVALGRAGLVVVPSLSEGLPTVIMEAMASGLPVVASAIDAIPELVRDGETGRLVPPGDPVRLAGAIADLLDRPELAQRMGAAGQRRVFERHDADRNARALLRRILGRTGPDTGPTATGRGATRQDKGTIPCSTPIPTP